MKAVQTLGKLVRISLARCKYMFRFVKCLLVRVTRDDVTWFYRRLIHFRG